ncbi:MAG: LysR family transcriptional regulator [Eggerthellaceae bacterium]|nr:LysR family transcriptional regulator [Eggerthellaceae bacterium]
MELSYLREFVTFSEYMNVSEAARQMHMSQPTLSHHISALEREVGVPLVNRATTPLTLTMPGSLFVNRIHELLRQYDGLIKEVHDANSTLMDLNISLDASHTAPYFTLMSRCYHLREANPNIHVHYHDAKDATAAAALKDPSIDCVAVYMCPIPSDLEAGVVYKRVPALFPNRYTVSLDKTHPLAGRTSLKWDDLRGMDSSIADGYFRLWVTTTRMVLEEHVPGVVIKPNSLEIQSYVQALSPDEFQLYDESCDNNIPVRMNFKRKTILLDEPEVSECYIAYLPNRVSPALEALLDYLDAARDWE